MAVEVFLIVLCTVLASSAESGFLVVSPKIYRTGAVEKITVNIVDTNSVVEVVLKERFKPYNEIVDTSGSFGPNSFGILELKIPSDAKTGRASLEVTVTDSANSSDVRTIVKEITIEQPSKTMYIQTDKPIYKPGETIRGRVIGINADLTPMSGKVEQVFVSNPSGVRMVQWNDLEFVDGIVGFELPLSQQPVLGSWTIKAKAEKVSVAQKIDIEKYVLPKFEVIITPPPFVARDSKSITITVCAKYTYGKLVSGDVKMSACVKFSWWHRRDYEPMYYCYLENRKTDGCSDFTVTMEELGLDTVRSYYNARLHINASVTENATGITMNATNSDKEITTNSVAIDFDPGTPKFFKPGMPFYGQLNVRHPDSTPVIGEKVNIVANSNKGKMYAETVVATNGIAYFNFTVPLDVKYLNFKSKNLPTNSKNISTVQAYKYSKAWFSPSNNFIQIKKIEESVEVGTTKKIEVYKTAKSLNVTLYYSAFCKGNIAVTGNVPWTSGEMVDFSLTITQSMVPKCRLLVYYVREDGEVVADNMDIEIEESFENQVSITFSDDEVRPGQETELHLQAAAGSRVAVSAVDKSVYLLKAGNEMTEDKVMKVLNDQDVSGGWYDDRCGYGGGGWLPRRLDRKRRSVINPSSDFVDSAIAFHDIGSVIFTNLKVETRPCPEFTLVEYDSLPGPLGVEGVPQIMRKTAVAISVDVEESNRGETSVVAANPVKVRSEFPETWIWFEEKFDNVTQEKKISIKVPDTITTWYGSAFAMSNVAGIGVSKRASINVFQPFFVSITMPYSVIRGEEVKLIATVFNYLKGCTNVRVSLIKSPTKSYKTLSQATDKVCICSNEAKSVKFTILPRALGHLPFTVSIKNTPGSICSDKFKPVTVAVTDAVTRKLLVEPEGVRQEYTYSTFFCPKDSPNKQYSETLDATLPESVVDGSVNAIFSVIGDIMGPSLSGLDGLLRLPTGCGEQNMLNFAPNIYVMQYLKNTNQLTRDIEDKATGFLRVGYQRELTYKRSRGSYSAFGDRDEAGSMWLTAFVVRSFAQARPFIFIDPKELEHSIKWMTDKQLSTGCFPQHGRILHKSMKGGISSPVTLTAFVVLAMLEAGRSANHSSVSKAFDCIEESLDNVTDVYSTAILAYTYSLIQDGVNTRKDVADKLNKKLMSLATSEDGLMYWKNNEVEKKKITPDDVWISPCHRAPSAEIEMTAYALMSIISSADFSALGDSSSILRWISKQRNSLGGFSSTQDTCVALQALAQYAGKVYGKNVDLSVKVQAGGLDAAFEITSKNSLVTNKAKIPSKSIPGKVEVNATGEGCALMQLDVSYNIENVQEEPAFDLKVTIKPAEDASISIDDTCRPLEMHICASWLLEDASNMAVISVKLVSGFEVDVSSLDKLINKIGVNLKRYEADGPIVTLYFNEIKDVCVSFVITQTSVVKNTKPGSITVYDFYDTDKAATTMYNISQTDCYGDKVLKDCPVCVSTKNLKTMKTLLCSQELALRATKYKGDRLKVSENYKPKSLSLKTDDEFHIDIADYCTCPQLYRGTKSMIFSKLEKFKDNVLVVDAGAVVVEWNKFVRDQFKSVLGKCLKE